MAVNKKMINTVHGHDHNIINELLQDGYFVKLISRPQSKKILNPKLHTYALSK